MSGLGERWKECMVRAEKMISMLVVSVVNIPNDSNSQGDQAWNECLDRLPCLIS